GFKESRIQGVEWFSWYLFLNLRRERAKESPTRENRETRGLEGWLHIQTSNPLRDRLKGLYN
ncbi:MAG TPA: hypothetical protein PKM38_10510, partial [Syntrophorhabdaceae bacterium]|nr:hypothetical protein [Syntrophorhabdaceae bacterium]HOF58785.1 hypothetical protein [Syntrophorhabdaceae bacterium]